VQKFSETVYLLSLLQVHGIGPIQGRLLLQHFKSAEKIFIASPQSLREVEGMSRVRISAIRSFKNFEEQNSMEQTLKKNNIEVISCLHEKFPKRLLHCYDCPPLLFYKGNINLNPEKILAVVGTRSPTVYGKHIIENFFEGFEAYSITILSGLAFGIDSMAHRIAIRNGLPTIAVLGHGLDTLYPSLNLALSKEMQSNGGLVTEFPFGTRPDRQNFPRRNRIVAGMCDAVLVVESGEKGGSIITAELAMDYNRDVFACPGRVTDEKSAGCNHMIKSNTAQLVNSCHDLLQCMNWKTGPVTAFQKSLFLNLNEEELRVIEFLKGRENVDFDLILSTGYTPGKLSQILLSLELNGVVQRISGNRYRISGNG